MIDETGFEIKWYRTCSSRRISQMKYDFLGAHTRTITHTYYAHLHYNIIIIIIM